MAAHASSDSRAEGRRVRGLLEAIDSWPPVATTLVLIGVAIVVIALAEAWLAGRRR